jgi:hypothetical protein
MRRLLDILHENRRLKKELKAEKARSAELYERLRTLDNAFYAYRCSH